MICVLSNVSNNTVHNAGLLASRYPDHGKGEAEVREPRIVTGHKVYQVNIISEFLSLFAIILSNTHVPG